ASDCRTVAQTLVHIAVGTRLPEQIQFVEKLDNLAGFDFFAFFKDIQAEEQKPRTKAEIVEMLKTEAEKFAQFLEGATEEFLSQIVQYPEGMVPPTRSRFEMLLSPKEHEMHHRGQLMVVERMLGLTPHLTRQMMERIEAMTAAAAQKA